SHLKTSSSAWAQGGIAAAVSADDSPDFHLEDTLRAGRELCDRSAVEVLTRAAPQCIADLERLGLAFDRTNGTFDLGQEGGRGRRRILHAGGSATGEHLIRVLTQRVQENTRIRVRQHTAAWNLVSDGERCYGATAYDLSRGVHNLWLAPATILATGG